MSLKKNLVYNVALQGLSVLFPLITAPYISRILGVQNVGVVSFITTYASYFTIFAMFGIGYYGVREIAKVGIENKEKTNQLFSELFRINSIATLIVSIIYIATIFFVPELRAYQWLYLVGGMSIYLVPISIDWYFQGQENFKLITIRSAVIKTLSFIGLFIFVREREDLLPYVLLSSFAIVGNQVWNIIYATKKGLKIHFKNLNIRQHLQSMGVFFLSNISVSIFVMLDVLMLGFLSTYDQVGLYTSSNKIILVFISLIVAINAVFLPRLATNNVNQSYSSNNMILQKAFDTISLIVVPASIGLYLCSSRFVPMFFGNEFIGSIVLMQILSVKVVIIGINAFFVYNVLIAYGYEHKLLQSVFVTSILSFVLNIFFIPSFGAIGVSISSVIAELFQWILNFYFVYKFTAIRVKWVSTRNAVICSTPILFIYFLMNNYIETSRILFLSYFIFASTFIYIILQIMFQNYILIQTKNLLMKNTKSYVYKKMPSLRK